MSKSAIPSHTGKVNPFFHGVQDLFSSKDLYKLATDIRLARECNKELPMTEFIKKLPREYQQKFSGLWERFNAAQRTQRAMPKPPKANVLYGRFDMSHIVDVGSGNAFRMCSWKNHLKITTVDVVVAKAPGMTNFNGTFMEFLCTPSYHPNLVFTSFLSATQLGPGEFEELMSHDGLHVLPDIGLCLENGISVPHPDNPSKVLTKLETGVLEEYDNRTAGKRIEFPFVLAPSYREKELHFVRSGPGIMEPYEPQHRTRPVDPSAFDWHDVGYKWDGTFYELETSSELSTLTMRNGYTYRLVGAINYRMCLHLEHMEENACYVLLRVEYYNTFVPPHSGDALRLFAERVKIRIDGQPVIGPPVFKHDWVPELNGLPTKIDGIISRSTLDADDCCLKKIWTVDFDKRTLDRFRDKCSRKGFVLDILGAVDGFAEYELRCDGSRCELKFLRFRQDKNKPTSVETAFWFMEMSDLAIAVAFNPVTVN